MEAAFEYVFPAIKGIQAKREYYVSMCPLRLIPKIFLFDEEELVPELRAQRTLNRQRIPELASYITEHREDYVFSAITASVDADLKFTPFQEGEGDNRLGILHIPMSATFIINDGQHRRAAIELAMRERPDLADETIAVVFFLDVGLKRCQQMFADLNRYAVKPSKSLGILYDHGDEWAEISRQLVHDAGAFRDVVEMEKTTLATRSRRLFTLSAIHGATKLLLMNFHDRPIEERIDLATQYWNSVDKHIKEWGLVRSGKISSGEVRQDFIHSHGVMLSALGRAGASLINEFPKDWQKKISPLKKVNWSRANVELWEGRAMRRGRLTKASDNVILCGNIIKRELGLSLTPEEQRVEATFMRGDYD